MKNDFLRTPGTYTNRAIYLVAVIFSTITIPYVKYLTKPIQKVWSTKKRTPYREPSCYSTKCRRRRVGTPTHSYLRNYRFCNGNILPKMALTRSHNLIRRQKFVYIGPQVNKEKIIKIKFWN